MKSKNFKKRTIVLNSNLIVRQRIDDLTVDRIKKLHTIKNCFLDLMHLENDSKKLKDLTSKITQIEFQLQKLWNFPQDEYYHRFWELPKCECPKMDNIECYGTGHRYINPQCRLHGN
jgi:hypothetical protein